MRNMSLGITAFVVSVGMISVGAQGRNFSGTWVIDGDKTMAAMQSSGETPAGGIVTRGVGGGGRGGSATGGVVSAGGGGGAVGGTAVARSGGSGGGGAAAGGTGTGGRIIAAPAGAGGGGGGRAVVSSDLTITMDGTTFSIDQGGFQTSYPLNGSEVAIQTRGGEAKARASWKGDMLIIEQTIDSPNGPVTSSTSWFLEGDSLVRLTTRRTYFKKK